MSELKVDTIKTYTPSVNGIQFPNGLYVNNTKIASNNTVETGQFIGIPAPAAAYPVPSGVNAMVSLGYFNSIIAAITGASGLAAVSAQVVAAEDNAKDYSDNNFLRKNTNTEHNGGGLTFSGGPYTIFTNTTPTLNLRSNNPRLQLTETDTAGSTGTISMDSGVLKILYGDDLTTSRNGLWIRSDGRVDVGFHAPGANYRLTAIPTNSALGYGAVLGYATNTSYFGILGYNGDANTDNLPTSFYGSGYLFNSGKAKITDTLLLTNANVVAGNSLLAVGGVGIKGNLSVTGDADFDSRLYLSKTSHTVQSVDFRGASVSAVWARGIFFVDGTNNVVSGSVNGTTAGLGLHGSQNADGTMTVNGLYMGHGGSPWENLRGLYITPNGDSGFGTNSPVAKLDVAGTGKFSGLLTLAGATSSAVISCATAPTLGQHLANKSYVDGKSSLASNGYTVLPNGLKLVWGSFDIAGANGVSYSTTFVSSFTTIYQVVMQQEIRDGTSIASNPMDAVITNNSVSTTGFTVQTNSTNNTPYARRIRYIAIGV